MTSRWWPKPTRERDRDHGGAGLGLAIVYESIKAHGGTIEVGDAPSGGARFEIRLPRAE